MKVLVFNEQWNSQLSGKNTSKIVILTTPLLKVLVKRVYIHVSELLLVKEKASFSFFEMFKN